MRLLNISLQLFIKKKLDLTGKKRDLQHQQRQCLRRRVEERKGATADMFTSRGAELPETTSNSFRVKIIRADSLYGLPPAATACHCLPRGNTTSNNNNTPSNCCHTCCPASSPPLPMRCGRLKRVHQLGSCQREHLIEATVAINKLQTDQHCGQPKNTREYTRIHSNAGGKGNNGKRDKEIRKIIY